MLEYKLQLQCMAERAYLERWPYLRRERVYYLSKNSVGMDGDGATDSTAHMYSDMADFLANDVKATPTAMGLLAHFVQETVSNDPMFGQLLLNI